MANLEKNKFNKDIFECVSSYFHQKKSHSGTNNVKIIIHKKKNKDIQENVHKKHYSQQSTKVFGCANCSSSRNLKNIRKYSSMSAIIKTNKHTKPIKLQTNSSNASATGKRNPFSTKYIVNAMSIHRLPTSTNVLNYRNLMKWKVYRCQLITNEEGCCCSCNSDAMFEVMKSLYDCYKKKNCDRCNCILCGHEHVEERRLGEIRKSLASVGVETKSVVELKNKIKNAEKAMVGKSPTEKENILKDLAMTTGVLPEGRTASEKSLVNKVRTDLGLPPTPKTVNEKRIMKKAAELGLLQPLEGKNQMQKEKILQTLADMGIPLPEGRTASEKELIQKVQEAAGLPTERPSERLHKAKVAGFLTPLENKSPEEKEKIIRGLAMAGIPLPVGKTPSEQKLINKVRSDIGLSPEPKTSAMRSKYKKAADLGLLQPLEGKTPKEKEKILQRLADMGIPLPNGRTASEKSLIAQIQKEAQTPSITISGKIRKAKAAGLITPLAGKTQDQKKNILKGLAMHGIPLPEAKTYAEKKLIDEVRADLRLPPEPKTRAMRDKHEKAAKLGLLQPLEGKTPKEKEKILRGLADIGIPLPEGRTSSEKSLIAKIKKEARVPSLLSLPEKIRRAKTAGLLTPLEGKTHEQKENILKGLAMSGIPLPEGKSESERNLLDKVRDDLGLPPEPKTPEMKEKHAIAANEGLLRPLQGKSSKEKEKILQGLADIGIPLPEGRTDSEKSLIAKVLKGARPPSISAASEKMRRAKAAGLLTPLTGKTPEQKEKILKGLALNGIPLPEGKTSSEKKLVDKVRRELGLPPEPKTPEMKAKYAKAADAGLLLPLEGKSPKQKERILQGLADMGIPLAEGRTPSERSLITKVLKGARPPSILAPSEKIRRAKAAGFLTPLKGKTPEQKENILKGLAMNGIPLPESKTVSEKEIADKVRKELGLPPEPKTSAMKEKYAKAADAGLLLPLEGKSPKQKERILQGLADIEIPLPAGRTPSEISLIAKVLKGARPLSISPPSEKMRRAKAAGLLTPLTGKTPEQKENIFKGLAMNGIPLPETKTASEKKIADDVRRDLGLPPEPKTPEMKEKYAKAADAGLLLPLEGKSPKQKERILQRLADMGIPLPEGRTPSEKSLVAKVQKGARTPSLLAPSEKMRRAKAEGLLTPLKGKTPEQKVNILKGLAMNGIPLPEGKTASERKLAEKVRKQLGLPPEPKTPEMKEKHAKAADAGLLLPLEGKSPRQKERILQGLADMEIPLPEGRTPSEKLLIDKVLKGAHPPSILAPSEKIRRAKAAGLLTPLTGKTPEQKENILRSLAINGIPLPESKTDSEKNIAAKVRKDLGLPPEPKTPEMKIKYAKAADAGLLFPLEGKSPKRKERILQGLADMGIPLPEGRTPSEKSLIAKVLQGARPPSILTPTEKMRRAKAAGLLTSLKGKTPDQKEKILKGLAMNGIPLPEGKTASEKKIADKVRKELGLPPEPTTPEMKEKYAKAADAGLLSPLEGKSPKQKERILQGLADMGIPLPEGRTSSEKSLIAQVLKAARPPSILPLSEKMRKAKAAGLLTPLTGKTPKQKENILRGLAINGIPLPEGKTASEQKIADKVRRDLGLPPEPTTPEMQEKYTKAADAGLLLPLEGKSPKQKERILQGLADIGIPLPEGRTPSEKSLVAKVLKGAHTPSLLAPSEKMRRAEAEGLLTPLKGKTPEQKENILKGLAMNGIPLPEGKTASERKLVDKVRRDLGLPPEPKTREMKKNYEKAADAGLLLPLEGKSPKQKERILQGLADIGIPLPEGRTPSEKSLITKVLKGARPASILAPSEKMRRAKDAGLLTPLTGKTHEQKENILKGLAMNGILLPESKTASEQKIADRVRRDLGLPPEPKTSEMKGKYAKAADAGLLLPLEGKSPKQKQLILQGLADMEIPLPEGRTPSEKSLVAKVLKGARPPSIIAPSEKMRRAKAAGLLTPLTGKTPAQKENILKGLAMNGIPLPEGKTTSEKKIADKVRRDIGLPPRAKTPEMKEKYVRAAEAGLLLPLEGKSPKQKKRILQGLADMGIPLPEGRTFSEKSLIAKVLKGARPPSVLAPSEKMRRAKAAGLLTPLTGKTPEQKENILRGLAMNGIPLPEGKTASEKKIADKVRRDLGLPPEPMTPELKEKYAEAADAGLLLPLEGKSPKQKKRILQGLADMGIPLPEGRTPSEKSLVAKMLKGARPPSILAPSEKMRRAKATGLLTPLTGKTPAQKENILKGLAMTGIPLPEGKTSSEKQIVDKVRRELGLPPEPKTPEMKEKYAIAADAGLLLPLDGKSPKEKKRILQGLADMEIPLPEGRTPSEKSLITKVLKGARPLSISAPSEKLRRAKAAGLLTPLTGKTPKQKENILKGLAMHGIPLPEGETASEKKIADKVRRDLGLPPKPTTPEMKEKYAKAADAGLLLPLESVSPKQKKRILQGLADMGIPLPEGRTLSEKSLIANVLKGARPPSITAPSEKMRRAKAAGLLTPLTFKTPEQKENILKGLALNGILLPEGRTASERKITDKVRRDLGLPPEPKTPKMKEKHAKAAEAGLLLPLEGKSPKQKQRILQGLADMEIPLPEGRTPSEKSLIAKVLQGARPPSISTPSEKMRRAKAAGLVTPLTGKTPEQKENILKGLAMHGIPLPEGDTASEKKIADKVRRDLGLPPKPTTPEMTEKYAKAADAGLLLPLEGRSPKQKERILQGLADMEIPLPVGRTPSEKSLIAKVIKATRPVSILAPSEKMRRAKVAGFLTPLTDKTPEQKENILKGLAMNGILIPEGKTPSEKKIADKVRRDLGLPPEPKTPEMKEKYANAADAGLLLPLEGKSPKQKKRILEGLADIGIPLPEGRTASEKSLIAKVLKAARPLSILAPSEKMRRAKDAGLLTPLTGKTAEQKENILKGLAINGIPLPEGKTSSEKKIVDKVRRDLGLPPEPKTPEMKEKYAKAADAGILLPLEGKSPKQKKQILEGLADIGIPLPEGRTSSEKSLIAKVLKAARPLSILAPSEKMRRARDAGLLTPLTGKTPEQKKNILKGLAMNGIPLPEGKTASEKKIADKVRRDLGLPPEPKTPEMKEKYTKAADAGLLLPLEGKSPKQKERILQGLADMNIPLPEGRTPSEKSLIAKVLKGARPPSISAQSEKMRRAKAAGLLTPLTGKTAEQKENILKGLAMNGIPLPEGKTASEKKIADKVRRDLGLSPEPTSPEMKDKYAKAADAGLLLPLEGKSPKQKERILQGLADMEIPLPEGRTPSERSLIAKVLKGARAPSVSPPSEKMRKAKAAGLLTPLTGKTPKQKENILKGLAMIGIPLPEGKTASEKEIVSKVRKDMGLPPEPKTSEMKMKYAKAAEAGLLIPLEGRSPKQKERILQGLADLEIPLPEGRTASEKSLITKVLKGARPPSIAAPSEKMRKAKAAGLLTPLTGKTPEQKENILKGLAFNGIPLPEAKTASEKKIADKVRRDLGLSPEPTSPEMKEKYAKAADAGLLLPLEGKSPKQKERILQGLADLDIPLPEGRTPSERSLIVKVLKGARPPSVSPLSEKMRKAKAAGLLTPLTGKTPEQKENILKGLAMNGIPLPEGKTASDQVIVEKVRKDIGLPAEPKTPEMREKYAKAADNGLLLPLEGKSPKQKERILQGLADMEIPLPEGRTASEKSLIAKVLKRPHLPSKLAPSEKMRRAKAAGLLTPLTGKTPEQKENILKGLAMSGIPLPEGKTASEQKIVDKVRRDLGLPPKPTTPEMKENHLKAADAGLLLPLEGKSPKQKERILQGLADMGISLPAGRTASEKSLIAKVLKGARPPSIPAPSEKMRRAKAAGLLTPLTGKTAEQKEKILKGLAVHGIPLPESKTASEKEIANKVRRELGLPPVPITPEMKEKYTKAADAGLLLPLEGKSPKQKERILQGLADLGIPLPEGRTPSEKSLIATVLKGASPPLILAPSEKIRRAKAAGLLTPLTGKTPEQKENILKGLAMNGILLPESKTASEKEIADKVREELGLPPEPKTPEMKEKYAQAAEAGLLLPLEGKSPKQKERILQRLADMKIPLPAGRTPSERSLIDKVLKGARPPSISAPSEKMRRAKAAGLLTPLTGKTPGQKENILKGLAMNGIPLPEAKTASEKKIGDKVRRDLGISPEPTSPEMKEKYAKAADAGLLLPLEGKSPKQKERILQGLVDMGIPLPEGRTSSEKSLVAKVLKEARPPSILAPSEKMRRAKAAGLLTPLTGKTPEQKKNILKGLAMNGIPLPEGKTASEKKIADKVRRDLGLPPEPKTPEMKEKYTKAADAGLLLPLEGKSPKQKERILQGLADMNIPLPEGRTPSEKSLIAKVLKGARPPSILAPSEKMRRAKAAGLLTPLTGKTPEQKENILKGLAMNGIPLPEGKTASEKRIADKVRRDLGISPEPTSPEMKEKYAKAANAGLLLPLEGKSPKQKERILQGLADMNIPLPEGRTPSEKSLIAKVLKGARPPSILAPSEKMRRAKAAGLLTPLTGKTPEQKENILKGLAMNGIPLPEAKTASEKRIGDKIRRDLGISPEPTSLAMKEKYAKAADAGLLLPLEGKSPKQKERILQGLVDMGIPLPEGRTPSEKSLIAKVLKDAIPPILLSPSEKMRKAKAAGLITPLKGKSTKQKEKILTGLASLGVPLPEGASDSERKLIDKVRADLGLPPQPITPDMKAKHAKAADAGLLVPLEGKSSKEKERTLRGLASMGIPLPLGRTPSERSMIEKVKMAIKAPSITTKKLRQAQAEGLLTPLAGKSPEEKVKIVTNLAKLGLPLPEGQTPSEKALIDDTKIKFGILEQTPEEQIHNAMKAGFLTPLAGKTPEQKEKILRGRAAAGLPLPEGRSPSERDLINKIKASTGYVTPSPSERLKRAKAAGLVIPLKGKTPLEKKKILNDMVAAGIPIPEGETPSEKELIQEIISPIAKKTKSERIRYAKAAGFLTPLSGKTPEQKEEIIRGLAKSGLPLPEAKTPSEKKIIDKLRAATGLPPEPDTPSMKEKYMKAQAEGLITPLEGKLPTEKENILKKLQAAGIPLPVGRTRSEKSMIKRIKARSPSQRLKAAKEAGLLTPLEGKTPEEKDKILRGLAKYGIPLPLAKTPSEKKIINKIRNDIGLPPEPETASMKKKMRRAEAAGLLTPLDGKTTTEKEEILKAQANLGLQLPEGRTSSEKKLIDKIKKDQEAKVAKARDAGLLTPLEGKSMGKKDKIVRGLAEAGLPLPEGRTPSEKLLIRKVKAEFGIPPSVTTPSEIAIVRKAKEKGFFTPLAGKTPAQKEKILRGLAESGLPLPDGKTTSEKKLIKKIRDETGLKLTPSKIMGKLEKKSKGVGVVSRKVTKSVGGIGEEIEEIVKTTVCDQACGCDKKKIKFKHSYVKIRVTSPDISSFCPCPNECIPGVKGGVFVDNEGIKVTVGNVVSLPSYYKKHTSKNSSCNKELKNLKTKSHSSLHTIHVLFEPLRKEKNTSQKTYAENGSNLIKKTILSDTSCADKNVHNSFKDYTENRYFNTSRTPFNVGHPVPTALKNCILQKESSKTSLTSIFIVSTDTSLYLSSSSNLSDNQSIFSFTYSSSDLNTNQYLSHISDYSLSHSDTSKTESITKAMVNDVKSTANSECSAVIDKFNTESTEYNYGIYIKHEQNNIPNLLRFDPKRGTHTIEQITSSGESIVLINNINNENELRTVVDDLLWNNVFLKTSSVFILIPAFDDEDCGLYPNSNICFK